MGYNLESVLKSNSVLRDGIDFFTKNPSQFAALVQRNIILAKAFAETFTPEDIKTMFSPGFFSDSKLLTHILTLIPTFKYTPDLAKLLTQDLAFKEIYEKTLNLKDHEILEAMGKSRLTFYDIDKEPSASQHGMYAKVGNSTKKRFAYAYAYTYVTDKIKIVKPVCWCYLPKFLGDNNIFISADDLLEVYQEMITRKQYVSMIISICKTLLKQLPTGSYLLDREFSLELWGDKTDNRLFSYVLDALQFQLTLETFSLVSLIIAHTSPSVVLKELSPDVFRTVIKQLPNSKKAFTQIIRVFEFIANKNGYAGLKQAVDLFNFDILDDLEKIESKRPYALAFYRIGEKALDAKKMNVMLEKYPLTGPKYRTLIINEKKSIEEKEKEINSIHSLATAPPPLPSSTTLVVFSANNPLTPPPPYKPPPKYNPEVIPHDNGSGYPTIN